MKTFFDCKAGEFFDKLQKTLDADTYRLFDSLRDIIYEHSRYLMSTDSLFVYCLAEAAVHEKLSDKKIMRIIKNYMDNANDRGYARLYKYIPQELL